MYDHVVGILFTVLLTYMSYIFMKTTFIDDIRRMPTGTYFRPVRVMIVQFVYIVFVGLCVYVVDFYPPQSNVFRTRVVKMTRENKKSRHGRRWQCAMLDTDIQNSN